MATLNKIRSKGTLLLIVVGLALAAFIVGDFINSAGATFESHEMAIINGDEIEAMDYMQSIDKIQEVYEIEYNTTNLPEETVNQLRESVWETTVRTNIVAEEAEQIGMKVTAKELKNLMLGDNVSPIISSKPMFFDANGRFSVDSVYNFYNALYKNVNPQVPQEQLNTFRRYWEFWEKMVKTTRLEEKYTNLLAEAIAVTPLEAKYSFEAKQHAYDVVFAMKNYFAIADSTVTVSDSEIKARYELKKEQFAQEKNSDIQYVVFNIKPSDADYNKVEKTINEAKAEFGATKEIASFTNSLSDVTYSGLNQTKAEIDADFAEFAFSGAKDSVMGPIFADDTYKMARIVENNILVPDSVKLRYIAINAESTERTKAIADSLMNILEKGNGDFPAMALRYSAAPNAKMGGEWGWVREASLTKDMAEKAFTAEANSYFQVNEGAATILFHVQELGEKVEKVKLAIVAINVSASSRTQADIYGKAKKFAADAKNSLETLTANAKEQNIQVQSANNIDINANKVNNINRGREIVRWAFENDENAVSDVIECDDKLVVAAVKKHNEKGYKEIDQVKPMITAELIREKKGEQLTASMKGKSIEQLRGEGFNVDTVRNINFNSTSAGAMGNEPAILALVASNGEKLSQPIAGNAGAYVFTVVNKATTSTNYNVAEEIAILSERQNYMSRYFLIEALKDAAVIEDLRYRYF